MRASGWVVVSMVLTACGCSCAPAVDGVLADDVLPAVSPTGATEHVHTLLVPGSGDLDVRFDRRDQREGYAGPVYLFVTAPDCVSVSDDPQRMRNGQAFQPQCAVLANSLGEETCCQGRTSLASPARVTRGQTVKVFVYGLSQPADVPYRLTYRVGDGDCEASSVVGSARRILTEPSS